MKSTKKKKILLVWICVVSFLRWVSRGFRRYANHRDGKKYDEDGNVKPQNQMHSLVISCIARIFKERDRVTADDVYQTMRKEWRLNESL